jgi:hypothetical protein
MDIKEIEGVSFVKGYKAEKRWGDAPVPFWSFFFKLMVGLAVFGLVAWTLAHFYGYAALG